MADTSCCIRHRVRCLPGATLCQREAADMLISDLLKSMLIRALRTFAHTFVAVLVAAPVLNLSGPALKAAAMAGLASVLSMVNRLLDETPVPSLPDEPAGAAG